MFQNAVHLYVSIPFAKHPRRGKSGLFDSCRRAHWGIESGLHYRRDVTLKEDATRMTVGNTGKVMASINNLVLALIRQAGFHNAAQVRRWFAAHLSETFALLATPSSPFEKAMQCHAVWSSHYRLTNLELYGAASTRNAQMGRISRKP